jgi:hypothetical protein
MSEENEINTTIIALYTKTETLTALVTCRPWIASWQMIGN